MNFNLHVVYSEFDENNFFFHTIPKRSTKREVNNHNKIMSKKLDQIRNVRWIACNIIHKIRKPGNKRARKNVSGPEFLVFENWELSARLLDTYRTVWSGLMIYFRKVLRWCLACHVGVNPSPEKCHTRVNASKVWFCTALFKHGK